MTDRHRCADCHRRPRIVDSVLCAVCGFSTIEASLAQRQQPGYGGVTHARSPQHYGAAAYGT